MNTDPHGLGKGEKEDMKRELDKLWSRLVGAVHGWVVRRGRAHRRRELLRRLERQVAWQKPHLN
jgi:hypothetical protein